MKKYVKPAVEVVEVVISDNIAAIAPRTVYRRSSSSNVLTKDSALEGTFEVPNGLSTSNVGA